MRSATKRYSQVWYASNLWSLRSKRCSPILPLTLHTLSTTATRRRSRAMGIGTPDPPPLVLVIRSRSLARSRHLPQGENENENDNENDAIPLKNAKPATTANRARSQPELAPTGIFPTLTCMRTPPPRLFCG